MTSPSEQQPIGVFILAICPFSHVQNCPTVSSEPIKVTTGYASSRTAMQAESTSHENGGMGLRNAGDGGPDEYRRNAQNDGPSSRGIANSGLHNGPGAWASISGDIHHQVDSHGPPSGASRGQQFQRISRPVELMRPSYDVVVIGSGYGGGVAASRMSRAKQMVCVLERGKERWPGEYPDKFLDAARELRISGEFAPGDRRSVSGTLVEGGNPTGLYHVAVGDGQNVYCANGLGGTSLVNANVFLEAHPAILDMHVWPKELRGRDAWKKCQFLLVVGLWPQLF